MTVATRKSPPIPPPRTVADLLKRLGVPASRILLDPAPGTATEADVIRIRDTQDRLCELVEGVLVEKAMGFDEARLAFLIGQWIGNHIDALDLGIVVGADGAVRLFPGLLRVPDVAFVSWDRYGRVVNPDEPLPDLAPDLVVEVLSRSNTAAEMRRKLAECRDSGVGLIWNVDPRKKKATVHAGMARAVVLTESDSLDGGDVLPGLRIPLGELFAKAAQRGPRGA